MASIAERQATRYAIKILDDWKVDARPKTRKFNGCFASSRRCSASKTTSQWPTCGERPLRLDAATVRTIVGRNTGFDCVQLIRIDPFQIADAGMDIWNSIHGSAEIYLNVLPVVGIYKGGKAIIQTAGYVVIRFIGDDGVCVETAAPRFGSSNGYSNAVSVSQLFDGTLSPLIAQTLAHPQRTTAAFVKVANTRPANLGMRERGEGTTRYCGSRASATAAATITKRIM